MHLENMSRWVAKSGPVIVAMSALVAGVILVFITGQSILSPGPLNAVASNITLGGVRSHAEISCGGCHAPPWGSDTMADRCLSCHKDVASQIQAGTGLHGTTLTVGNTVTCTGGCHSEHNGATTSLSNFDHNQTNFPLTGRHLTVACQLCHTNGVYTGTPTTCFACHQKDDAHSGVYGQDCGSCHNTGGWSPATFNGTHTFPMNHGTGRTSPCVTCHPAGLQTYSCYGCHEHTVSNIQRKHENIANLDDCVSCHPTGGGD
jgi:hypothetical protein